MHINAGPPSSPGFENRYSKKEKRLILVAQFDNGVLPTLSGIATFAKPLNSLYAMRVHSIRVDTAVGPDIVSITKAPLLYLHSSKLASMLTDRDIMLGYSTNTSTQLIDTISDVVGVDSMASQRSQAFTEGINKWLPFSSIVSLSNFDWSINALTPLGIPGSNLVTCEIIIDFQHL